MSTNKLCIMDTESVINEVRSRECLWNNHDEAYKSKFLKQQAWLQVCEAVSSDFSSRSKYEQKQIERAVQSRWKTARDAYMKCRVTSKKPGFAGKYKYVFYDQLTFLEQTKDFESEIINEILPDTSNQQTPLQNDLENETDPLETEEIGELDNSLHKQYLRNSLKRKRTMTDFEEQLLKIIETKCNTSTSVSILQEDDQHFFNSLGPIINKFDNYKKLAFRSRILELAIDIGDIRASTKDQATYNVKIEDPEH